MSRGRVGAFEGAAGLIYSASVNCVICEASDQDVRLAKCPICFKWSCDRCCVRSYGREFCSRRCADQFFFGDDDEE